MNKRQTITKKLQPSTDLLISFTEEELEALGLNQGDKFSVYHQDDGSILLEKFVTLELETEEWPRNILEYLIKVSCEKDVSVNEVINDVLGEFLKIHEDAEISGLSDEEFVEEMKEELEELEYGSSHKEFIESTLEAWEKYNENFPETVSEKKHEDEFDDGLAFIPMGVYTKLDRIIGEYNTRKQTLGFKTEPNLYQMAKFLSIAYGSYFSENQVRAIVEMKKQEDEPTKEGMVNLNFHQRVQNIIFGAEELEEKLGRRPSVWELTDALVNGGIDVKRNHVAAILEIDKETKENKCCGGKCSSKKSSS